MNNQFKKIVASLLAVVMLLSMLPISVLADGSEEEFFKQNEIVSEESAVHIEEKPEEKHDDEQPAQKELTVEEQPEQEESAAEEQPTQEEPTAEEQAAREELAVEEQSAQEELTTEESVTEEQHTEEKLDEEVSAEDVFAKDAVLVESLIPNAPYSDKIKVYREANTEASLLTELNRGDCVIKLFVNGEWVKIRLEDKREGYILNAAEEVDGSGESTEELAEEQTGDPAGEAAEPIEEATEPVEEATEPDGEATEPVEEVAVPDEEATEPVEEATEPVEEATEPVEEVTEPVEEVTEPGEEVTEPIEEQTEELIDSAVGDSEGNSGSAPVFKFNGYKTLNDFGIRKAAPLMASKSSSSNVYLNPQTIRPSSSYYGYQWICNRSGYSYPFTATFTLDNDYMPQNSVYIAIANYDCDEIGNSYSCEYDQVYINGNCIGVLTGNDETSNTSLMRIDRSFLKAGTNTITIYVGIKIKAPRSGSWTDPEGTIYRDDPYSNWWLRVDDIQVLCDGGSNEGKPDVFRVNLTNAELSGNKVNCYVTTQVEDSQSRTLSLEYALYDWSSEESATYGQIIDDDFATIYDGNYKHEGTLTMPANSLSGTYTAVVYLKVRENGEDTILAYDEESFEYETGIAPAFDIQNFIATPATLEWTSQPVTINLSADIDVNAGLTDLFFYISDTIQTHASIDESGHVTGTLVLPENGFYTVEIHYTKEGKNYKKSTTVEINNILTPLASPVLNVTKDFNITEGDTVDISWNQVENATAYSIIVWDFTNGKDNATEEDRVDDQTGLTYSHTFKKAGTYVIGVYSRCPGSTEYCQSVNPGAVNVYVTKGEIPSKLGMIRLNVEQDDLVIADNFEFTWNKVENADYYLFSLRDITDSNEGPLLYERERIESDADNSFAVDLTAGRRYRAWICAVPEELDYTAPQSSAYSAEFNYKIVPAFEVISFDGNGMPGASGTLTWSVPTSKNGIVVNPDQYVVYVYHSDANGTKQVYDAVVDGTTTSLLIDGSIAFTVYGLYTITVYATMYESWGGPFHAVADLTPAYSVGNPEILEAGLYSDKNYKTGNRYGFSSTYTFWATTSMATEEVYVYCNNKPLNNGQPLTVDSSELLSDNTRRYKIDVKIGEGKYTISFRTKDGASEKKMVFCGIHNTEDVTKYATAQGVELRTWPSSGSKSVAVLPLNATVEVRGEIDISGSEGYDYIKYNGTNYFVKKGLLSDTPLDLVNDDLEADFRAFVKGLSTEYYSGIYDLNKYYYEASKVKHEWDDGGFVWSRRNDPYSTYAGYDEYDEYNIPVIQSMLIDGIQEKADSLKEMDVQDYSFGIAVNPITGDWEVNKKAVLAQKTYDAQVDYAIEQAKNTLSTTLANSLVDVVVVVATQGKTPDAYANIMDAVTNVVADAMNAYADVEYTNLQATLQNSYHDLMAQSVLDMYSYIEEELFADYTQLYGELQRKGNLTNDEKILKEQLGILLNAINSMPAPSLSTEDNQRITAIAEELVNSVGLEKIPALSDEECTAQIISQVAKSILINSLDAAVKTADPSMSLSDTILKDIILNQVNGIWDTVVNIEIVDYNGDGVYGTEEIVLNAISMLVDQNIFRDSIKDVFEKLVKKGAIKSLDAEVEAAEKLFKDAWNAFTKSMRPKTSNAQKVFAKSNMEVARKSRDQVKAANNKLKDSINTNKLTGIGILVEDLVNVVCDTFTLAAASTGLANQADGEVFYAYLACSMYHTMQNAETRRGTLKNEYFQLSYLPNIDTADIDFLKKFVNRIYAVYETDMLGHSYYVSLDMGWQYQTTEKLQEAMDEFNGIQDVLQQKYGTLGQYGLNIAGGWMLYPIYSWVGGQKSEYLKAVDKMKDKGGYGWINYNKAVEVYAEIAEYASGAKIPAQYQQVGK